MLRHRVAAGGAVDSGEDSSYGGDSGEDSSYEVDSGDDSSSIEDLTGIASGADSEPSTRAIDLGEHRVWQSKKKTKHAGAPLKNGGLPDYARGLYDTEYWRCTPKEGGSFVAVEDITHNLEYVLPVSRVNKALRFLTLPSARALFDGSGGCYCTCKKQSCHAKPGQDTWAVLRHRYAFFQQPTEHDATTYMVNCLRPHNTGTRVATSSQTKRQKTSPRVARYVLNGQDVCSTFFRHVFGISKNKLSSVRAALMEPEQALPRVRVEVARPKVKYNQCVAFWTAFFKNCQRPNDHTRLFPVNMSYTVIYEEFFVGWFRKVFPNLSADDMPSDSIFRSARRDPKFNDVKNRPKHHHCRCETCANLQARRLKVFNSQHDQDEFKKEWEDHQNEKRWWRKYEDSLVMRARHSPKKYNCFWFDDTTACGFPAMTRRPLKNLPTTRLQFIPFLIADLARGKDYYVYTAKGRFKKGANRLCSTLLRTLRATKTSQSDARHARVLNLIADNFSENKNNTLFAFLTDLVVRKWYDTIVIVFGPPGHTHNGGDKQHQILNEILFNFYLPTFVHMLRRYPQAWRQEHSRPTPCLLDVQYNFDEYYAPFIRRIGGYTNTEKDPVAARAFKFERTAGGIVTMQWKTKAESGEWRGADGQVGTPGFELLRALPKGFPKVVEPTTDIMQKKYYKQLVGNKMQESLRSEGYPEAVEWLKKVGKHGVIPIDERLQEVGELSPGALGSTVRLRCGDTTGEVQIIEDLNADTGDDFWALPADLAADLERHEDTSRHAVHSAKSRRHPAIGYQDVAVRSRATYDGSAAQAYDDEQKAHSDASNDDDESESSSSSSEDSEVFARARAHTHTHTHTRTKGRG